MKYIFLDTETTGLDAKNGDRIIEIGCIEMQDRVITNNQFHEYFYPERKIPIEATNIHGITNDFVADKPLFKDKINNLIEFIKGATVIAHNANFDVGFLDAEFEKAGFLPFKNYVFEVIDSLKEARAKYPGRKNSLDALCDRLEIDRSNRDYHGALLDSILLSKVWIAMNRGQNDLFMSNNISGSNIEDNNVFEPINIKDNGIVINASNLELEEHNKFIGKLKV